MYEFISTTTGQVATDIWEVLKITLRDYKHYRIINHWTRCTR